MKGRIQDTPLYKKTMRGKSKETRKRFLAELAKIRKQGIPVNWDYFHFIDGDTNNVCYAFTWEETPQGWAFWDEFCMNGVFID